MPKKKPLQVYDPEQMFQNRLRAEKIVKTINENLPVGSTPLVPIPKEYIFRKTVDSQEVVAAIHSSFELIGGVPGLIRWGTENPNLFYPMWARLSGLDTVNSGGVNISFSTPIPANSLDRVSIDAAGNVIIDHDTGETPE